MSVCFQDQVHTYARVRVYTKSNWIPDHRNHEIRFTRQRGFAFFSLLYPPTRLDRLQCLRTACRPVRLLRFVWERNREASPVRFRARFVEIFEFFIVFWRSRFAWVMITITTVRRTISRPRAANEIAVPPSRPLSFTVTVISNENVLYAVSRTDV